MFATQRRPDGRPTFRHSHVGGKFQSRMTATTSTIAAAAAVQPSGLGYLSHRRRLIAALVLPPVGATVALLALHHAAGQSRAR